MLLHAPARVQHVPIEVVDDGADLDDEARLFEHFPGARPRQRLTEFHAAARQVPLALQRLVPALHENDLALDQHDRADADDWSIRIVPQRYAPITLTTTRFFRWPSNSA